MRALPGFLGTRSIHTSERKADADLSPSQRRFVLRQRQPSQCKPSPAATRASGLRTSLWCQLGIAQEQFASILPTGSAMTSPIPQAALTAAASFMVLNKFPMFVNSWPRTPAPCTTSETLRHWLHSKTQCRAREEHKPPESGEGTESSVSPPLSSTDWHPTRRRLLLHPARKHVAPRPATLVLFWTGAMCDDGPCNRIHEGTSGHRGKSGRTLWIALCL
jgi:hypothetical protein